jgi:predicted MarR family transcription regulator
MQALSLFAVNPAGCRHRDIRPQIVRLRGRALDQYAAGQTTYDLRRLRLHGLIERVPRTHRYRITALGARVAMLHVRMYARGVRPTASLPTAAGSRRGPHALERLDAALTSFLQEARLVA